MPTAPITDPRHYENLPMCGFCMNAWDTIYMRSRPGNQSPMMWIAHCKVGGCDPDVWDHVDEETGWPIGFTMLDNGRVDWRETVETYQPPDHDDRVFHMRLSDGAGAAWRKTMGRLVAAFSEVKGSGRFKGNGKTVPDHLINWGDSDDDDPEEDDEDLFDPVSLETDNVSNTTLTVVDDDEIEW